MDFYDVLLAKKLGGSGGGSDTSIDYIQEGTMLKNIELHYTIPNSVDSIYGSTSSDELLPFKDNEWLTSVKMPSTIHKLPKYCFSGCKNLREIDGFSNITSFEDYSLQNCSSLTGTLDLSNCIDTSIGSQFVRSGFSKIILPSNIKKLNTYAFQNMVNLTTVEFPELVDSSASYVTDYFYGTQVFGGCTSLQEVTLPKNVTKLGSLTFNNCTSLRKITLPVSAIVSINSTSSPPLRGVPEDCAIYVPSSLLDSYKTNSFWSARADYIQAIPS